MDGTSLIAVFVYLLVGLTVSDIFRDGKPISALVLFSVTLCWPVYVAYMIIYHLSEWEI